MKDFYEPNSIALSSILASHTSSEGTYFGKREPLLRGEPVTNLFSGNDEAITAADSKPVQNTNGIASYLAMTNDLLFTLVIRRHSSFRNESSFFKGATALITTHPNRHTRFAALKMDYYLF